MGREKGLALLLAATALGSFIVVAVVLSLGNDDREPEPVGSVLLDIAAPETLPLSPNASAQTTTGEAMTTSGTAVALVYERGDLSALDIPIVLPEGAELGSFVDPDAGLSLVFGDTGNASVTFNLPSRDGTVALTINADVSGFERRANGVRISLGDLRASTSLFAPPASAVAVIQAAQFEFGLQRLPRESTFVVRRLDRVARDNEAVVQASLDGPGPSWNTVLVLKVDAEGLASDGVISDSELKVVLGDQIVDVEVAVVRIDDQGRSERLVAADLQPGSRTLTFNSPSGFSTFVVLQRSAVLATATPEPTPLPQATPTAVPTATETLSPTATATPTATPTPTPTSTPEPTPSPTPIPTATATPQPTATPTPLPTRTPVPTPRPLPTPTPLPLGGGGGGAPPTPVPTPVPRPTPTATPLPPADARYGVVLHTSSPSTQAFFVTALQAQWLLDFNSGPGPAGFQKVIAIMDLPGPSVAEVQALAAQTPGAVWYIVGEPNRRGGYLADVDIINKVPQFAALYTAIKAADPTALITSPSVLNWAFTCNGCGGYRSGQDWMTSFIQQYNSIIGSEPPIDIWAIDVYPLDWLNIPTVDASIPTSQISGMRDYLNTLSAHSSKPIWVTELALHWGWTGLVFVNGLPTPCGTYQTAQVLQYFQTVFDWLEANSSGKNIQRWFTFSTYKDIMQGSAESYAGVTLFDGPSVGAALTPVGQYLRNRILGTDQLPSGYTNASLAC